MPLVGTMTCHGACAAAAVPSRFLSLSLSLHTHVLLSSRYTEMHLS